MTNEPNEQDFYGRWLAERRAVCPSDRFSEQVMNQVVELERQRKDIWWLLLVERIERSRVARWAVCGGALTIGGLPFLFLVRVSSF